MRGQTFLDIVLRDDAVDIEEEVSTGHRLAKVRIDSNMLPIIQPDTYHSFNGDGWLQSEFDYYLQEPFDFDLDWGDHNVEYDHPAIIKGLSEAIINELPTSDTGILRAVEFWNTWSPREYNFGTDSFDAEWTIDLDALAEWLESREDVLSVELTMRELFRSRDGFISHVPGYFDREEEWANVWGALYLWLKEECEDDESMFLGVAEQEHNVYSENTTIHWTAQMLSKVTGWDEDECDELEQEDIDELVWDVINQHHNWGVYQDKYVA